MLGKSELVKRLNRIPIDAQKRSEPQIKNGDIALTYTGLLVQGKTQYEAVKEMADDPKFFRKLVMGPGCSNVWRYAFRQVYLRFVPA